MCVAAIPHGRQWHRRSVQALGGSNAHDRAEPGETGAERLKAPRARYGTRPSHALRGLHVWFDSTVIGTSGVTLRSDHFTCPLASRSAGKSLFRCCGLPHVPENRRPACGKPRTGPGPDAPHDVTTDPGTFTARSEERAAWWSLSVPFGRSGQVRKTIPESSPWILPPFLNRTTARQRQRSRQRNPRSRDIFVVHMVIPQISCSSPIGVPFSTANTQGHPQHRAVRGAVATYNDATSTFVGVTRTRRRR